MDPLQKYGAADLFMTFVARMEMYSQSEIEEIKDYIMQQYGFAAIDDESRAIEACVGQFLTQLVALQRP